MTLRLFLWALSAVVASSTLSLLLADIDSAKRLPLPAYPATYALASVPPSWQALLLPLTSDVEADHAWLAAFRAVGSTTDAHPRPRAAELDRAAIRIKRSLSTSPSDAELWVMLAILEAQRNPHDPTPGQALKMAYFTAPNDGRQMPARLQIATASELIADPELRELVRGDVRLMISRRASQKDAVVAAYRRASKAGRDFLEEAIRSIDPSILPSLRG